MVWFISPKNLKAKGSLKMEKNKDEFKYSIDICFTEENLMRVWKKIKRETKECLLRPPLDYIEFESECQKHLKMLIYNIKNLQYRTDSTVVINGAKRDGLTRPHSFLKLEDQLVYKTICDIIQQELHRNYPEYVGFTRKQKTHEKRQPEIILEGSSEWFFEWLKNQSLINRLIGDERFEGYIVCADISSYFPSINLNLLKTKIQSKISVESRLINLLFYILKTMVGSPEYSLDIENGLPQEQFDTSRILAHFFLEPVDNEFKQEGEAEKYVRWMDDMIFEVTDKEEGRSILRRLQHKLESLGLFLNTAKTKIIRKDKARQIMCKGLDEYLDIIDNKTRKGKEVDINEFEQKTDELLEEEDTGIKDWDRLLKRFYTYSRRIGSEKLKELTIEHLTKYPTSARQILSYIEGIPFDHNSYNKIFEYIKSGNNIYEDVEIRIYEMLLLSGVTLDYSKVMFSEALSHLFCRNGYENEPMTSHAKGLISLMLYKHKQEESLEEIADLYQGSDELGFIHFAFNVLFGTEIYKEIALEKLWQIVDRDIRRMALFVVRCEKIEHIRKNWKILSRILTPINHKYPDRFRLNARFLPFMCILKRCNDFRKDWAKKIKSSLKILEEKGNENNRDLVVIDFIKTELKTLN